MTLKYPEGTILLVLQDDARYSHIRKGEKILLRHSKKWDDSYWLETDGEDMGWIPEFIENKTLFKPIKVDWKKLLEDKNG